MKLRLLFFMALLVTGLPAQDSVAVEELELETYLQELKQGFLLIRLQDKQQSLEVLEAKGMAEQAATIRQRQYHENKETMLSFEQTFDFAPVYFFYAKNSEAIRSGNLAGHVFDANNEIVASDNLQATFYVGEFSETKNLGIDGLIILNRNLIPLEAPLPHFERKYTWFGLVKRSKAEMAAAYNKKLKFEYNKHLGN